LALELVAEPEAGSEAVLLVMSVMVTARAAQVAATLQAGAVAAVWQAAPVRVRAAARLETKAVNPVLTTAAGPEAKAITAAMVAARPKATA
jgi:hypothetical protein